MSLSSNTAQTRELTELRNHLKWLDEERRKSSRKMAELEQRLAQQGRDLAERDQKIQELEWHVSNFSERLERLPEQDPNDAAIEQRLQDLEWHLSNMNAQLNRMPNMDEERARLQDEVSRAITAAQGQIESNQAGLESRLQSEIVSLRHSSDLVAQVDEQSRSIQAIDHQFSALQESVGILSAQLRERTNTLAAEAQANYSSLAEDMQEHLENNSAENQARIDAIATGTQERIDALSSTTQERMDAIAVSLQERFDTVIAELESGINEKLAPRTDESLPEIQRITADLTQQNEGINERIVSLSARLEELQQQLNASATEGQTRLATVATEWESRFASQSGIDDRLDPFVARLDELEEQLGKLGHVREIMPLLDRLERELELRQAEEVRLSNLIGTQENRFAPLAASLEELTAANSALLSRLSDSERLIEELRANVQDFNENWKPVVTGVDRRLTPLAERMTVLSNNVMKAEAGVQSLTGDQSELREMVVNLIDDENRRQSDMNRQLEAWQVTLDENKDTIERFTQQWITLSNQYKEARMAVQNFAHWQKQLEQQKREASEMLRVESNRMQSRWDGFMMEIQEKLKNFELELSQKWQAFEIENEHKWSAARRNEQLRHEEIAAVDELIQKLQQDNRNLIWRVQAAQADAIKKWPRLLMEEVEKAVELNPNRRLSPATQPRSDMSVVDAIEQGLITIDYNDDPGVDL